MDTRARDDTLITKIQYEFPMIIGRMSREEVSLLAGLEKPTEVFEDVDGLLEEILRNGLVALQNLPELRPELFTSGVIELWRGGIEKEEIPLEDVTTRDRLPTLVAQRMTGSKQDEVGKSLVFHLVDIFAEENCFFDEVETELQRRKAGDEVEEVIRKLVRGQVIVRKGDIIDDEDLIRIRAIGESAVTFNINTIVGTAILLAIIYAVAFMLLGKNFFGKSLSDNEVYFLTGMAFLYIVIASALTQVPWESNWIPVSVLIPIGLFGILATLIIETRIGFIFTVLLSLLGLLIFRMDAFAFLFSFLSGMASCAVVLSVERRIDLVKAGLLIALINFLLILMVGLLRSLQSVPVLQALGWGLATGFSCGILSLGFLPILEHAMNTSTRFRLMELSDLNSPIFKKMLNLAPGTYNHSIMVANLAESACTKIGANALLARVGGYYHDIGKIDSAKYFIENQRESNLHDELKPRLSAAVIRSHVKVGIEKAKEFGLPKEVIGIISQHHGKGLISYFYQRALNDGKTEKNGKISSNDFSYSGEWPKSKEAAVVMLADAAEAAARTLKNPTVGKLEKFIWNIIMDKFDSGELQRSNLTFADLEDIKNSFVHILAGYYHSRIEYPSQKEDQTEEAI
jgi:putative nucleotidyltransferase with HDIG domain